MEEEETKALAVNERGLMKRRKAGRTTSRVVNGSACVGGDGGAANVTTHGSNRFQHPGLLDEIQVMSPLPLWAMG